MRQMVPMNIYTPSDLRLVLSHFINILYIQLYYMFIYSFQINIFIGILQGSSIKFGIESKKHFATGWQARNIVKG